MVKENALVLKEVFLIKEIAFCVALDVKNVKTLKNA
jgi:hypothetical protein